MLLGVIPAFWSRIGETSLTPVLTNREGDGAGNESCWCCNHKPVNANRQGRAPIFMYGGIQLGRCGS